MFTIAGGLFGFLFHRTNPPVYEAVGRFSASIDFVATGPLTQFEEDIALNKIGDLIYSTLVMEKVAAQAQSEGLVVRWNDLPGLGYMERKANTWLLRVRHADPAVAEHIARIWVAQGQAVLLESYDHAIQARQLSQYVLALENCLAKVSVAEPAHGLCDRYRFADIQADLQSSGEALFRERQASRGLFYGLTLGPASQPVVSSAPVLYGRNQLILAGGLFGLVLGILLNQLGLPARWLRSK